MQKHFIALLTAMYFMCSATAQQATSINFGEADYATVMEAAKTQQRNVLFYFTHPYCAPCKIMERTVLNQTDIIKLVDETVIAVKVDCVEEKPFAQSIQQRYRIQTFPSMLMVDSNGHIIQRATGFMDKLEMLRFLKNPALKKD